MAAEDLPGTAREFRKEVQDKLAVYESAGRSPIGVHRVIVQKQCEDFLVEQFEAGLRQVLEAHKPRLLYRETTDYLSPHDDGLRVNRDAECREAVTEALENHHDDEVEQLDELLTATRLKMEHAEAERDGLKLENLHQMKRAEEAEARLTAQTHALKTLIARWKARLAELEDLHHGESWFGEIQEINLCINELAALHTH